MSYRSALRQYMEILRYIKGRNYPTKHEILDYLSDLGFKLEKRTLERYMQGLRDEFDIYVSYNSHFRGYEIINSEEKRINNFLKLVEAKINADVMVDTLKDAGSKIEYIQFEHADSVKGILFIREILFAIRNRNVISFKHQNYYSSTPRRFRAEPYFLKEYQGRWYFFGFVYSIGGYRSFGLDRIQELNLEAERFKEPKQDFKDYYNEVIGLVVEDKKVEKVLLEFTKIQAKYIKSLPLHHSQRLVEETDKKTVFEFFLIPNYELEQKILMYGETVKILAPQSLKDKIAKRIRKMNDNYRQENN